MPETIQTGEHTQTDVVLNINDINNPDLFNQKFLEQIKNDSKESSIQNININSSSSNNSNNTGGADNYKYIVFDNNVYNIVNNKYVKITDGNDGNDAVDHYCRLLENLNKIINDNLSKKKELNDKINKDGVINVTHGYLNTFSEINFLNMDIIDTTDTTIVSNNPINKSDNFLSKIKDGLKNGMKVGIEAANKAGINIRDKFFKKNIECKDMYEIIILDDKITFNKKQISFKIGGKFNINDKNTYSESNPQKMCLPNEIFGTLCALTAFFELKKLEDIKDNENLKLHLDKFNNNKLNLIYFFQTLKYLIYLKYNNRIKGNIGYKKHKRRDEYQRDIGRATGYAFIGVCVGVAFLPTLLPGLMVLSWTGIVYGSYIAVKIITWVTLEVLENQEINIIESQKKVNENEYNYFKENPEHLNINTQQLNEIYDKNSQLQNKNTNNTLNEQEKKDIKSLVSIFENPNFSGGKRKHKTHKKPKNKKPKNTKRKHTKKYKN